MILDGLDVFAGTGYLTKADVGNIRQCHRDSIDALDGHVVSFIQALNFSPTELNSVFATRGDDQATYKNLWDVARQSSLSDNRFIRPTLLESRQLWKKYRPQSAKL